MAIKNLRYPKDAVSRKEQGRVMVQFIITAKGEVIQPEIVRSVSPSLDKEALRVVSKMPAWNPGRMVIRRLLQSIRYLFISP